MRADGVVVIFRRRGYDFGRLFIREYATLEVLELVVSSKSGLH